MCEFPSWLRNKETGEIRFLTDKDVEQMIDSNIIRCWEDGVGHSAIEKMYGHGMLSEEEKAKWEHLEVSHPPREVLNAIFCGDMKRMAIAGGYSDVFVGGKHEVNECASVLAYNSVIVVHDNSGVTAHDNSSVTAHDNSSVYAYNNSSVYAYKNSRVYAHDNSSVYAYKNSRVLAYENSSVLAYDNSSVAAYDNSSVYAYKNSRVKTHGNAVNVGDNRNKAKE